MGIEIQSTATVEARSFFDMTIKPMTIGKLSKAANVKVTTIRYYENVGLMGEPDRSESGQRLYGSLDVERLSFIRHARELGFPMDDIRTLIDLQTQPSHDCATVNTIASNQLEEVRKRLSQLTALEAELERMVASCKGGQVESCRVMAAINDHAECVSHSHERVKPL